MGTPVTVIQPDGWPRPPGYSDGILAGGRVLAVSGQVGWDPRTEIMAGSDFATQTEQALRNIADVLAAADAGPEHLVRMTWYVTDRDAYIAARKEIGAAYREIMGRHYPAMSVVVVADLLEEGALLEIEATAIVPGS